MKRIIELPSGRLEFADEGQGRPILFLHGGHANAGDRLWHKGFDPNRFRLLTPSRPGYGQSPLPRPFSAADTAGLMAELLDALNIREVIVVGISAGGYTALEMAARHPQKVTKLLLLSAVVHTWLTPADDRYRKAQRLFRPGLEKLTWAALKTALQLAPHRLAARMFGEFSTLTPGELDETDVLDLRDMLMRQSSGAGFLNDLAQQPPGRETLARISCPVLLQHSRNDAAVPLSHAEYAAARLPQAILKTYDNLWGHLLWLGADAVRPIADARAFVAGDVPAARRYTESRLVAF